MQVLQSDLSGLERYFAFRNKERIAEMLNLELLQFVLEARDQILKYFPSAELVLEWQDDPEEEPLSGLILWVETELEVEEAYKVRKQFGENWWYANSNRLQSRLSVLVESKAETCLN